MAARQEDSMSEPEPAPNKSTDSKRPRGFAAMSPELHLEIARKGGRRTQEQGKGHHFTPDEAQRAGRLGGMKVSADREHMAAIGRNGARARVNRTLVEDDEPKTRGH